MSQHEEVVAFIHMDDADDNTEVGKLRKYIKTLQEENQRLKAHVPKRANPAVVGLAGFGATTLLLQLHNLGWIHFGTIVWTGLFFGGLAQMIAGLMEFATGNNFGFCAFTSYGAFWISLATILISKQLKWYEITEEELGAFLLVFTLFTIILWIGSARQNMALFITFTLLVIGFILLDVTNLAHVKSLAKVAGVVLILCALGAWYCMAHIIFLEINKGKDVVPLGPSPYALIFERQSRKSPGASGAKA